MKQKAFIAAVFIVIFMLGGCHTGNMKIPVSGKDTEMIKAALINTEGNDIGEVTITEESEGVTIRVVAEGLTPGEHGFHIHEKGQCTPPSFESAGSHFNPTDKEHGFHNPKGFHFGDLPNIEVDENGMVDVIVTTAEVTLKQGKENSILDKDGTSLVIHEKADDYKTDPSGNSGDRIACAVVEKK